MIIMKTYLVTFCMTKTKLNVDNISELRIQLKPIFVFVELSPVFLILYTQLSAIDCQHSFGRCGELYVVNFCACVSVYMLQKTE